MSKGKNAVVKHFFFVFSAAAISLLQLNYCLILIGKIQLFTGPFKRKVPSL